MGCCDDEVSARGANALERIGGQRYGYLMIPIDARLVGKVSSLLSGRPPQATTNEARAVVAGLHAMAARAPEIVASVSGMGAAELTENVPVHVVDRERWAQATAESLNEILQLNEGTWRGGGVMRRAVSLKSPGGSLLSMEVGVGLALMAKSVLGQYDPLAPEGDSESGGASESHVPGHLLLVAPNILEFQRNFDLDRRDLALWVAVHELTHAAQFAQAPWLRDYIVSRARPLIEAAQSGSEELSLDSGPGAEITAIMSLLEGHAEYVMNAVPIALLPAKQRLLRAMKQRREQASPVTKWLQRVTGMDMKMAQYSAGGTFVSSVIASVGVEGLNVLWEDPLNAPSPEEISSPLTWVHRVLGEGH